MGKLRELEPLLSLIFRAIVIAILIACYFKLDSIKAEIPSQRDISSDVDKIQRDIEAMRESINVKRPSDPGPFYLRP